MKISFALYVAGVGTVSAFDLHGAEPSIPIPDHQLRGWGGRSMEVRQKNIKKAQRLLCNVLFLSLYSGACGKRLNRGSRQKLGHTESVNAPGEVTQSRGSFPSLEQIAEQLHRCQIQSQISLKQLPDMQILVAPVLRFRHTDKTGIIIACFYLVKFLPVEFK
jgi:hypothetical protein